MESHKYHLLHYHLHYIVNNIKHFLNNILNVLHFKGQNYRLSRKFILVCLDQKPNTIKIHKNIIKLPYNDKFRVQKPNEYILI